MKRWLTLLVFFLLLPAWLWPSPRDVDRYALILDDPPVAAHVRTRRDLESPGAREAEHRLLAAQQSLRRELARRGIAVTGSVRTLLNAVFVRANQQQLDELRRLPGVRWVAYMPPIRLHLDRAVDLANVRAAWNRLGNFENAGAGVKIGIIDSGIDHEHPAFQDPTLQPPPGYPKCAPQDCPYTNNKIIVARSYVKMLAAGTPPDPAADSRPDDLSPRDRVGHGTAAAMIVAGRSVSGPSATITGVAPKAFLGNYKIFGSPGVNDYTFSDVLITALEDALHDGMDVVTLSLGSPALYGPLDTGIACGEAASEPCDVRAMAVENAVKAGLLVVVSAGNDGDFGVKYPALTTINTPGTAPSALTVGAVTNAHVWLYSVNLQAPEAPAELRRIPALFGDGPKPASPLTAPLRDVEQLGNDGRACTGLPAGSLAGALALVARGGCSFALKVHNAQNAGAVGVVIYQLEGLESLFSPAGLGATGIPAVMIPNSRGKQLKAFLATHRDAEATLDPWLAAWDAPADEVAPFSSRGPSLGENGIKPELVTVGTDLYLATQSYDPNSEMWDPSGFTAASGTSFAAPLAAGVAALIKQLRPALTPGQLKSTLVNTANPQVSDGGQDASVTAVGAGKLDAVAALEAPLTVEPATLSFGILTQPNIAISRSLTLTNIGQSTLQVRLSATARVQDASTRLTLAPASVTLAPGASTQVAARLEGSRPAPGTYEGEIRLESGARTLRVPYLYIVGDNVPFNAFPILGYDFNGVVNEKIPGGLIALKVVDRYGAPAVGVPVRFSPTIGRGFIDAADEKTDNYGIAAARVYLGPFIGEQQFAAAAGNLTVYFDGWARLRPTINSGGVVNAASFERGKPVAPGSYIAIFGEALSDTLRIFSTPYLPLSLAGVSVSFDAPAQGLSLPGRLHFVSPTQVNVQVPWELGGLTSVRMKVSIGEVSSAVYTLDLADYAPGLFERAEASGQKFVAALDENYRLIGSANPARRGRIVQLYANGLGPVDNTPPSGEPTPAQPLAVTRAQPEVLIAGRRAQVHFSGLAPFVVGLYQINVTVPADAPVGPQPVTVSVGGVTSKSVLLPLQ